MKKTVFLILIAIFINCRQEKKTGLIEVPVDEKANISYARGFAIKKLASGITEVSITSPWPNSGSVFSYALVPREKLAIVSLDKAIYNAIIPVPVNTIVLTSTTHIPALEALGEEDKLIGFPNTDYISSEATRKRIDQGFIKELGNNENINTEILIALNPEVVVGFGIENKNRAYESLVQSEIPVVYNGDWTENTPLGKAEWIKFFAPFFQKEQKADSIFKAIESAYLNTRELAKNALEKPSVLTGGLYKDVWYVAGGKSWMAQFLKDANTNYLWKDTPDTGSISLSFESVLNEAKTAEFWLNPSQHLSYDEMQNANRHYIQFSAFKMRKIYTNASTRGATGGLIFYELAASRPDLVLKDLIHLFHPELLPDHQTLFFKPLQ